MPCQLKIYRKINQLKNLSPGGLGAAGHFPPGGVGRKCRFHNAPKDLDAIQIVADIDVASTFC
jgi:hypothetical protein